MISEDLSSCSGRATGGHCRIVLTACIALLFLAIGSDSAAGQDTGVPTGNQPSAENPLYFTIGLGPGTMASSTGLGGQLGLSFTAPIGEFTIRSARVMEASFFGPGSHVSDVALLYDWRGTGATQWYGISGGPGLAWMMGKECVSHTGNFFGCNRFEDTGREWALGLAFQSTIGWRHISLSVLGDVNDVRSFAALTVNLHIGRVR